MLQPELINDLKQRDGFFSSMINLVPIDNFGFPNDVRELLKEQEHEAVDRKLNEKEKARFSGHSKKIFSKLDFNHLNTISDIWSWLDNREVMFQNSTDNSDNKNKLKGKKHFRFDENLTNRSASKNLKQKDDEDLHNLSNDQRRTFLVKKMQAKLELLKKQRKANDLSQDQKREKRREKNLERRMKRIQTSDVTKKSSQKLAQKSNNDNNNNNKKPGDKLSPIKNDQGKIVYSKFDFVVPGDYRSLNQNKQGAKFSEDKLEKRKRQFGGKDYKTLLKKVEKREKNIEQLKKDNPEKVKEIENAQKWDKALEKAQGFKIKDDKRMLKMNIKKKEKRKQLTKQDWDKRKKSVQIKIDNRQKKRRDNLQKRRDDKRQHRIERSQKRGRVVF